MGAISVTANIVPADCAAMFDAFFAGKIDEARKLHYKLEPLHGPLFLETNPIPVKYAASLMGKCTADLRMPLTTMSPGPAEKLRGVMKELRLI